MLQSSTHQSFFFADLVGFTALTEEHGDEAAADLALAFADAVSLLAAEHGAEMVKTLGDAVMIRCPDHCGAVRLALRILEELSGRDGFPAVRIGMHTGPAVERAGDWFGATVNLAARVAASAEGGELLITEATRAAIAAVQREVTLDDRGARWFKNVLAPLFVYAAASAVDGQVPVAA
jgi:class 3 adenylate cyclase